VLVVGTVFYVLGFERNKILLGIFVQGGHKPGKTYNTRRILRTWKATGIMRKNHNKRNSFTMKERYAVFEEQKCS